LLADVGGTNARFALLTNGTIANVRVLDGSAYSTIVAAARAYLKQTQTAAPVMAAFDIAAPLTGDAVRMTNHTWHFSVAELRRELDVERLIVLNDFTALAMSLRHIPSGELEQCGGRDARGDAPIALIGPGTGLGVSGLIPSGDSWLPLQGEGGHATLAASTQREADVIEAMRTEFTHVSAERAISGPGLVNLYSAVCALDGVASRTLQPADVADAALANTDPQCAEALRMFCAMLGTVAGNLALTLGAFGGVYIGGGIVPRLGAYFAGSEFRERFENKGRYKDYLAAIPAYVVRSEAPAFYGLARAFVDSGPRVEAWRNRPTG
jgi:glucokinase